MLPTVVPENRLLALDIGEHDEPLRVGLLFLLADRDGRAGDGCIRLIIDDVDVDLAVDLAIADATTGDDAWGDIITAADYCAEQRDRQECPHAEMIRPAGWGMRGFGRDARSAQKATAPRAFPIYAYPRSLWPRWYRPPWQDEDKCECCR